MKSHSLLLAKKPKIPFNIYNNYPLNSENNLLFHLSLVTFPSKTKYSINGIHVDEI
jgi:hypothetical protein